jgi:hypothetical protein
VKRQRDRVPLQMWGKSQPLAYVLLDDYGQIPQLNQALADHIDSTLER